MCPGAARPIDLRSDTVTRPTAAMRAAMAAAEVGDDGWGDDPTVARLEARVAELTGKDAGVFMPSGTMANQVAVRLHTAPGAAIATVAGAHVQCHEGAGAARGGAQIMALGQRFAGFAPEELAELLAQESTGWPRVALVWLENTLGLGGGAVWPLDGLTAVSELARAEGRALHLDGARLWNAEVATGIELRRWCAAADTVSLCLSKGLGAPVGSVLVGTRQACDRARAIRQALGGTMRQAGILAAAGLHALDHHRARLERDHVRARTLAERLSRLPALSVRPPQTNMVLLTARDPALSMADLERALARRGVLASRNMAAELRLCLHLDVGDDDLPRVVAAFEGALDELLGTGA